MSALTNRRNLLIGAACAAGLGVAEVLRPRRHVNMMPGRKLAEIIPRTLTGWTSSDVTDLVAPRQENSLASRLYGQTVGREYVSPGSDVRIMMLAAYGETQSRDLQLHRPESCYPAIGFSIVQNNVGQAALPGGGKLPVRRLVAEVPGRRECILYWSRVGEFLPVGGMEQRVDVLRTAINGYFADGLLMRVSAIGADPDTVFRQLDAFVQALLAGTQAGFRPALVGHALAAQISA